MSATSPTTSRIILVRIRNKKPEITKKLITNLLSAVDLLEKDDQRIAEGEEIDKLETENMAMVLKRFTAADSRQKRLSR
jgi:hypothetical protein